MAMAGVNPLIAAISEDKRDITQVERLITKENINTWDERGATPLWAAAIIGDVEVVGLLLRNKADPNIKNQLNKFTPLMEVLLLDSENRTDSNILQVITLLAKDERTDLKEALDFTQKQMKNDEFCEEAHKILLEADQKRPRPPNFPKPKR